MNSAFNNWQASSNYCKDDPWVNHKAFICSFAEIDKPESELYDKSSKGPQCCWSWYVSSHCDTKFHLRTKFFVCIVETLVIILVRECLVVTAFIFILCFAFGCAKVYCYGGVLASMLYEGILLLLLLTNVSADKSF